MSQPCRLEKTAVDNWDAYRIGNGQIELVVIPELGGKIASLVHGPSGTEWLWRNPYLAYRTPVYAASYVRAYDVGGLDECFPSVGAAFYPQWPWAGTPVPDHGELWSQPWQVTEVESTPSQATLSLACAGVRFPYCFERTIAVEAGRAEAHLAYRATNLSSFPFPFLWSIHPLLRIEPGMRLGLPAGVSRIRVDFSPRDWLGQMGTLQSWPTAMDSSGHPIDLSTLPSQALGEGVKFFTLPLAGDGPLETALVDSAGERSLRFRFQAEEISHVGVWMNCGGWTPLDNRLPYYNLALEPCIGGSDSLSVAVDHWREHGVLEPRQARTWSLDLILT